MAFGLVSFNPVIRSYSARTGSKESLALTPLIRSDVIHAICESAS